MPVMFTRDKDSGKLVFQSRALEHIESATVYGGTKADDCGLANLAWFINFKS